SSTFPVAFPGSRDGLELYKPTRAVRGRSPQAVAGIGFIVYLRFRTKTGAHLPWNRSAPDVAHALLCSELHLLLAFAVAGAVFRRALVIAGGTGNTFFVVLVQLVLGVDGTAAGTAEFDVAFREAMADSDALVEDKAFAFPEALFAGHFLKIL